MQIQVVMTQLELHKIDNEFENSPHIHDNQFQVTMLTRGTCYFRHDNKELALSAGDGLIMHPQDRHSFYMEPDASLIIMKVNDQSLYPSTLVERLQSGFQYRCDPSEVSDQFRKWTTALFALDRVDRQASEEMELQVLSYLDGLLWGGQPAVFRKAVLSDRHFSRVLDYIHGHYTEQMSVDLLASIALQSRYHFIRSFKALTGLTPYQYVLQLRIEKAKDLLGNTAATVTEISYSLGFSSASQFYRAFLKSVGMTPETFRSSSR